MAKKSVKKYNYKKWYFLIAFLLVGSLYLISLVHSPFYNKDMTFGVSFDPDYARYLKLDVNQSFTKILNEYDFRYIRLPAHWDKVEPQADQFDFSELDNLLAVASSSSAKVILAVGQKTPRWPECHFPAWAKNLNDSDRRAGLLKYMSMVVERYRNNLAIEAFQVENEPYLPFGDCPQMTAAELKEEMALTRRIAPHVPVLVADSGELSVWNRTANVGDLFGTTMYRVVWNRYIGYWNYDWLTPLFYRIKLWLANHAPIQTYIIELQAEPWMSENHDVFNIPLSEQYRSMNLDRLKKNINYARQVGFARAYLWGAEWWQYLAAQGYPEIENYVKELKK